jgi:hypothetical protein
MADLNGAGKSERRSSRISMLRAGLSDFATSKGETASVFGST